MFLLEWYREYKAIKNESRVCDTCEALKLELAKAHDINRELLSALTSPKVAPEQPKTDEEFKPITPKRHLTFTARRQMLQAEDKARAVALAQHERDAKTPVKDDSKIPITSASVETDSLTDELEREMDIAAAKREAQTGTK